MVERIYSRFSGIIKREHWWAEFWSGIVALGWGLQSLLDSNNLLSIPAYHLVSSIVPESYLNVLMIFVGITQLWSLIKMHDRLRGVSAIMAGWLYSMFVWSFLSTMPPPPGWLFCLGWVGVNMFAVGRWAKGLH